MKNMTKMVLALALCLISSVALAAPKQGGYVASGQLTGWFFGDHVDNLVGPSANILAYYTDNVAVGGRAEVGFANDSIFSLLGEVRYDLPKLGELSPYVGGVVGPSFISSDKDNDTALKVGGLLGVRSYIKDDMAVFGEFQMGFLAGRDGTSYFGLGVGLLFNL